MACEPVETPTDEPSCESTMTSTAALVRFTAHNRIVSRRTDLHATAQGYVGQFER